MEVVHDREKQEFRVDLGREKGTKNLPSDVRHSSASRLAYLTYELQDATIDFQHTFVPPTHRGQGIAEKLASSALNFVQSEKKIEHILPSCSYIAKNLSKAPQYARYLVK